MKQEQLSILDSILSSETSIKNHIAKVKEIRELVDDFLIDEERQEINNKIKEKVQEEANIAVSKAGGWGAVYNATGTGKSKIAINRIRSVFLNNPDPRVLIVVPTEKLRDDNWRLEFQKWGMTSLWTKIDRCCYVSLNKIVDSNYDLVILDEGHNITDANSEFFFENNNHVSSCMVLSATKPTDREKLQILKRLNLNEVYSISVDEAIDLGLIAPYEIIVITMHLNDVDKYLPGTIKDPTLRTEKFQYSMLCRAAWHGNNNFAFFKRSQFIGNLKSKTETAKLILKHVIPQDKRTMIFCGSKDQAIELCQYRYFSKSTYTAPKEGVTTEAGMAKEVKKMQKVAKTMLEHQGDESLNKFRNEEINRISCVNALNEGHDLPMIDIAFMVQINGSIKDFIQRMGRALRFRPGYVGKFVILTVLSTVDEDWLKKVTKTLNQTKITYIELARLRNGIETIDFNN